MKVIIVDDESFAIEALEYVLEDMAGVEVAGTFQNASEALDFVRDHKVDLAFLDIEMPGFTGIELAGYLKEAAPDIQTVFVTGYNNYAQQAFDVEAVGYILKPFSAERVQAVIDKVGKRASRKPENDVVIRTFGRFDIFVRGELLIFKSQKAKELVALCVDHRGGVVTMEEAIDKLWEDRLFDEKTKKLYRKAVMIATHTFEEAGAPDIFQTRRGLCYIERDKVYCDYYKLLEGEILPKSPFTGEYLFEYSWAEERVPEIWEIQELVEKQQEKP
ncbi:Protein-glutamate methylesterase/protein-glutamine glutaminase [Eubacterium callanderi]|uniref:response regulator n=1 Tax=Eubacterium callanderi TaxID=53442 RepID=UPI0029FECA1C|nr:response regulator [Eubacterium callanderi]WPK66076.1 Protein-glutamate methylesterase/protein-glutamine glutaminase [Eubacterium callanderi]WPK70374.1 Protein-glutamate methylesterase/protein-glutamine glutaminase [Eubacterium callanderi]